MATRKPKKGYVYLLKNTTSAGDHIYKYGCTSVNPDKRCKEVNYDNKKHGYEFKVIAAFKSFDIFADEHKVRCDILPSGIGMISEVFSSEFDENLNCDSDVIHKFLTLGGVLR